MKHRFTYTLFTKDCKKQKGEIKASSSRLATKCLKIKYPGATKIKLKGVRSDVNIAMHGNSPFI